MIKKIIIINMLFCGIVALHSQQDYYRGYPFESGNYYMLDDNVNIRSEPNLNGNIIGKLRLHDEITILENTGLESIQNIENVWAYWYKIKHNEIIGYIWGGYTAVQTLIYDIDGNGIDDWFQYRISIMGAGVYYGLDPRTDIFIYINGNRIDTGKWGSYWGGMRFEKKDNKILIYTTDRTYDYIYEFNIDGSISLIKKNEIGY